MCSLDSFDIHSSDEIKQEININEYICVYEEEGFGGGGVIFSRKNLHDPVDKTVKFLDSCFTPLSDWGRGILIIDIYSNGT